MFYSELLPRFGRIQLKDIRTLKRINYSPTHFPLSIPSLLILSMILQLTQLPSAEVCSRKIRDSLFFAMEFLEMLNLLFLKVLASENFRNAGRHIKNSSFQKFHNKAHNQWV